MLSPDDPKISMIEAANLWYTKAPLGPNLAQARANAWLTDIEAAILATALTVGCCARQELLEKAKDYLRQHPAYVSPEQTPDEMRQTLEHLLETLHSH